MGELRKITINLPASLVDAAIESSGKGLTETIRDALMMKTQQAAWEGLRNLRGTVQMEAWEELRGKSDDE